jgi:predicted GIY-YIG superfamily endonuclease
MRVLKSYALVRTGHAPVTRQLVPSDPNTWADLMVCRPGHELLYRLRSADGALLYVGVTWSAKARFEKHKAAKPWWLDVASVDIECHLSDWDAHEAEYTAITTESPRYNIHGVRH